MTDVELDERVAALEENGAGGGPNGNSLLDIVLYVKCVTCSTVQLSCQTLQNE